MRPSDEEAFAWSRENVHLWTIDLQIDQPCRRELAELLAPDEIASAARFHFDRDQRRYVATRGALRNILAGYLQVKPAAIALVYGPVGKPTLAPPFEGLHFNVAHSRELAVIAVAARRVGVDVERLETKPTLPRLAERLFTRDDAREWASMSPDEQTAAFYRSWTWKEAYLKATGRGFASSMDGFSLQLARGDALEIPPAWRGPDEQNPWSSAHFSPGEGFIGAVAIESDALLPRLRARPWF